MLVIDEPLLNEFRQKGRCEWCARKRQTCPHHLHARGMGGGGRLDIRVNLVALCQECHDNHHLGNRPLRCDLLAVVAAREKTTQDQILEEIWRLRRTPGKTQRPNKKQRKAITDGVWE